MSVQIQHPRNLTQFFAYPSNFNFQQRRNNNAYLLHCVPLGISASQTTVHVSIVILSEIQIWGAKIQNYLLLHDFNLTNEKTQLSH